MADRRPAQVGDTSDSGDRAAAFVRLADEHLDKAYRLARAILHEPAEAQDATHDAFVQAWRKWDTLRDASRFEPWFDRILVNTCRNRLRSKRWQATDISAEVALATGDHAGPPRIVTSSGVRSRLCRPTTRWSSRCATTAI